MTELPESSGHLVTRIIPTTPRFFSASGYILDAHLMTFDPETDSLGVGFRATRNPKA